MDLDRRELRDSARRMLAAAGLAPQADKLWPQIVEMGWLGLTAPEELGGLGQPREALWTLYAELGRVLAATPFLASMLTIDAICAAPDFADRQTWVERLFAGELVTASLQRQSLQGRLASGGYQVSGALNAVPDADKASHVLVALQNERVCALLPLQQPGVEWTFRKTWDQTRRLFEVRVNKASLDAGLVLARGEAADRLWCELQIHRLSAIAADCVGGAAAALAMTVDYLQIRRQFARPLATFQALKHRCADLHAMIAATEALLWAETPTVAILDSLSRAGALKSQAGSVFHAVAEEAIQLHGGIGLTSEHPCHLFVKRALLNASLAGEGDVLEAAAGETALRSLVRR
jgi:alkylation response protein AidB-like acyl-CoA dehydrogenase